MYVGLQHKSQACGSTALC